MSQTMPVTDPIMLPIISAKGVFCVCVAATNQQDFKICFGISHNEFFKQQKIAQFI